MKKTSPLKGRKQPASVIAKRKATYARMRAEREQAARNPASPKSKPHAASPDVRDALAFLNKAIRIMRDEIRSGAKKELTDVDVYVHMAKRTLEGGML